MANVIWYPGYEMLVADIVRAEDCTLYDSAGRKYLDLEAGVWCASVGHGHPRLLRILAEQAGTIAHTGFSYSNRVVADAAAEVLDVHGFAGGHCVFLCSGSEAVEYGVRVAQSIATRPLFLTMADSYFGAYGSAHLRQPDAWVCFDWMDCAACTADACDGRCARWASLPFDRIGGFLFEPGSSSGLVRFPPRRLIDSIVQAIAERDGLVLINEVTTGIGRTGEWFGYQHYGIRPHIVAMGKGLGGGYPVSATVFAPGVIERLAGPIKYSQSHQNDPLGAAVAREVLRILRDEKLIARARETGRVLAAGLEAMRARTGKIAAVRSRGLMAAVELQDAPDGAWTREVQRELVRRGYMIARRPGLNVLRIDPPLTIKRRDIERFLETFEDVLKTD